MTMMMMMANDNLVSTYDFFLGVKQEFPDCQTKKSLTFQDIFSPANKYQLKQSATMKNTRKPVALIGSTRRTVRRLVSGKTA